MNKRTLIATLRGVLREGGCAVLLGPAGIGKSSLAEQVRRPFSFAVAQCLPAFSQFSYRPLAHAVGMGLYGSSEDVATSLAVHLGGRLLVVEDLHWADDSTMAVLELLVGRIPFLATSRVRVALADHVEVTDVVVKPLDARSAASLVRRVHPELSGEHRARLLAAADGNPLLLCQLANAGEVSPTLNAALSERLRHLSGETVDALSRLALHGRPAPPELVGAVGSPSSWPFIVSSDDGSVWFSHAEFAGAVVAILDDDRRRRLLLELTMRCDDGDAARHHVTLGNFAEAAVLAERAAEDADTSTRADLLWLASQLLGSAAPDDLRHRAAASLISAHRPADALVVVGGVSPGNDLVAAEAGLYTAQAEWLENKMESAIEIVDAALLRVAGTGSIVETRLIVERAAMLIRLRVGDPELPRIALEALEAADGAGVERARARNTLGLALSHSGQPGWADQFRQAADLARASGDVEEECAANYWLVSALGFYGPMVEAIKIGTDMLERTQALGLTRWRHHFLGARALHLAATSGLTARDLDECRTLLRNEPHFRNRAQVELALVAGLVDHERGSEAALVIDEGRQVARNEEERSLLCCATTELALMQRDVHLLVSALDELATYSKGFFGLNALAESATVYLLLATPGDVQIPQLTSSLTPVLDVVRTERMAFDDWRAGRPEPAIATFLTAAAEWDRRGLKRFAHRAYLGAAEVATMSGAADRAVGILDDMREIVANRQPDLSLRRLTALRRELAVHQATRSLTARQLEIMRLVADGFTSQQIGKLLSVETTTVNTHIAAAVRRLGCQTRSQAAALVAVSRR